MIGVIEERLMLEQVDINIAIFQADVGGRPVAELDQLHLQPLLFRLFDCGFQRRCKGSGGADFQRATVIRGIDIDCGA